MVEQPTLYDHQHEEVERLREALRKHKAAILCANPGVGKTRMSKWMLASALNRKPGDGQSGRMLFAVHRRGLVDNAVNSFDEHPALPHGVIMSQRETRLSRRVQVASIDTLLSWWCEGGRYDSDITFDLIVFDECHSHHSKLATFFAAHNRKRSELELKPSYLIGLTATAEAKGLADIYGEIVTGPTTEWLIENGYLSSFRYVHGKPGQLGLLVRRGAEFTKDSVSAAMTGLAGDLVRDYQRFAEGRPAVGFFSRLSHAKEAQAMLNDAGINAHYLDGSTDDDHRQLMFHQLNEGKIDYICNVGVVERGTDIPRIGCVQLCTAIGSVVRYRQMIGRGSRVHPEKTECLVLDHGGNVKRHGLFEDEIAWTLDRSRRVTLEHKARPTIECPGCSSIYRGGRCKHCGYEPTRGERRSQGLDFDKSELREITRKDRKPKKHRTCEEIMISALYMAGRSNRTWKQALGIAYGMAKSQGTRFRVPRSVEVAGRTYSMLPYGSPDSGQRVRHLYEFTR